MAVPVLGDERDVRRAWWGLGLFVVSFVAAFVTGEGLVAAFGYGSEQEVPVGVALAAGLPACLVFALPAVAVWWFDHRAEDRGDARGRPAVLVAVLVAGAFLAADLGQLALRLVR